MTTLQIVEEGTFISNISLFTYISFKSTQARLKAKDKSQQPQLNFFDQRIYACLSYHKTFGRNHWLPKTLEIHFYFILFFLFLFYFYFVQVLIDLTAANHQVPLLIYIKYKVTLPDLDYVITKQHKLVPSVIDAGCFILKSEILNIQDSTCITIFVMWKGLGSCWSLRKASKINKQRKICDDS